MSAPPRINEDLLDAFRNDEVVLFIGSGSSVSAGLPDWPTLLGEMVQYFFARKLIDSAKADQFRALIQGGEYPHVAGLCKDVNEDVYYDFMRETLNPFPWRPELKAPSYVHWFEALNVQWIITTNFDLLLEEALPRGTVSLTWKDCQAHGIQRYLSLNRMVIFHVHGSVDHPETIVQTERDYLQFDNEGSVTLEVLFSLATRKRFLIVGYSLQDPVIKRLSDEVAKRFDRKINWYWLTPESLSETSASQVRPLNVKFEHYRLSGRSGSIADSHANGIENWFSHVGRILRIEKPLATRHIHQITPEFLSDLDEPDTESLKDYYQGGESTWQVVSYGHTIKRKPFQELYDLTAGASTRPSVILAASAEGKSTMLKQLAIALSDGKRKVYFAERPSRDLVRLVESNQVPTVYLVDNAEEDGTSALISAFRFLAKDSQLVMAARTNEWRNRPKLNPIRHHIKEFKISELDASEADKVVDLLLHSKSAFTDDPDFLRARLNDPEALRERLKSQSEGALLSIMYLATLGKPLVEILRNAVDKIAEMDSTGNLIAALEVISTVESKQNFHGDPLRLSLYHFCEILGVNEYLAKRIIWKLGHEVRLNRSGDSIGSRSPIISRLLNQILFEENGRDEVEVIKRIIIATAQIEAQRPESWEGHLLWHLPNHFSTINQWKTCDELFEIVKTRNPRIKMVWRTWYNAAKKAGDWERARQISAEWNKYFPRRSNDS